MGSGIQIGFGLKDKTGYQTVTRQCVHGMKLYYLDVEVVGRVSAELDEGDVKTESGWATSSAPDFGTLLPFWGLSCPKMDPRRLALPQLQRGRRQLCRMRGLLTTA